MPLEPLGHSWILCFYCVALSDRFSIRNSLLVMNQVEKIYWNREINVLSMCAFCLVIAIYKLVIIL